jgi:hypothetical protein
VTNAQSCADGNLIQVPRAVSMTVVLGGHLLLAPAPIAARAVTTVLGLMLVRLAHQTARARALRTLALVIGHADKSLHKRRTHVRCIGTSASSAERLD